MYKYHIVIYKITCLFMYFITMLTQKCANSLVLDDGRNAAFVAANLLSKYVNLTLNYVGSRRLFVQKRQYYNSYIKQFSHMKSTKRVYFLDIFH